MRASMELPPDLVVHILRGNVGLSTWVSAQRVCKGWRDALRSDAELLTALAEYTGGLTRTQFAGLLGLTSEVAASFPCKPMRSKFTTYFLYAPATVRQALRMCGGLESWERRLVERASYWPVGAERRAAERWLAREALACAGGGRKRMRNFELEERHHRTLKAANRVVKG